MRFGYDELAGYRRVPVYGAVANPRARDARRMRRPSDGRPRPVRVLSDEVCVVVVTDSALVAGKDTSDHQDHL
jgi:hypothetical protein